MAPTRPPEPLSLGKASRKNAGFLAVVAVVVLAMGLGWVVATSRGGLPAPAPGHVSTRR